MLAAQQLALILLFFCGNFLHAQLRIINPMQLFEHPIIHEVVPHECGIALIYLRKPLSYFIEKYKDPAWGLRKLYLLMEKQRNRGQDGAGLAVVKFDMPPGEPFMRRTRACNANAIEHIFDQVTNDLPQYPYIDSGADSIYLKQKSAFLGEVYLGHLRYATYASNTVRACQPYVRRNNVLQKTLALAGNFNMANTKELFAHITRCGFTPTSETDTQIILDLLAYHLDKCYETEGSHDINLADMLHNACRHWDGGYVFAGIIGNGNAFVCRDPAGIRPGFMYCTDEVVAIASERVALSTVFNTAISEIQPLQPGHVTIINKNGTIFTEQFVQTLPLRQCTFERIYFSRGNDPDIYKERKALGKNLAMRVLDALNNNIADAVFSYIPNTSEPAFLGLIEEINRLVQEQKVQLLEKKMREHTAQVSDFQTLQQQLRIEKIAHKDQLVRSFITQDKKRLNLVTHLYGVTKDIVKPTDTLVVIDDSIVRGTTLKKSIIHQLARLNPAHIIIVSSAPPVLYPDCYGIDMSQIDKFIAFQAMHAITVERGNQEIFDTIAKQCRQNSDQPTNELADAYAQISLQELEHKIAQLVLPKKINWYGKLTVIYQTVDGLRDAMPEHTGDWYFSGNYPTLGGYNVLRQSYLNWYHGCDTRAY
jgi:amidophosphoribosyltransferase